MMQFYDIKGGRSGKRPLQVPSLLTSLPSRLYFDAATSTMYPKWLVFVLTLLGCLFLMASAAPVAGGDNAPVKRLKQFQARRPNDDGTIGRR